jgi:hypothetical protein
VLPSTAAQAPKYRPRPAGDGRPCADRSEHDLFALAECICGDPLIQHVEAGNDQNVSDDSDSDRGTDQGPSVGQSTDTQSARVWVIAASANLRSVEEIATAVA